MISSSPRIHRSVFFSFINWMKMSCSGYRPGRGHGPLEVERQPLLDALHPGALRQVQEQDQVQHQGRRQDRIPAQEVDLDLHRVAHPPEDVDVVPAFLGVAARRIVVDPDHVVEVLVELRVEVRLEDVLQHRELGLFLGLEGARIVQHLAVPVAQDVGREPARRGPACAPSGPAR